MHKLFYNKLLITFGWFFVLLGAIGAVLPLLPTTPFLIVALALFSRSSPRFHQMLLENQWFGPSLKQWEETKTLARETKKKSTLVILFTFLISILILHGRIELQIMLVGIAVVLLFFIWRLKEPNA
ncbi:MAG: YbaN family protein [Ghiorsea sp.]